MPLFFDAADVIPAVFWVLPSVSGIPCSTLFLVDDVPTFAHVVVDVFFHLLLHMLQSILEVPFQTNAHFKHKRSMFI